MVNSPIVLDTGVLSSFLVAGWFENLDFIVPDHNLVASESVWHYEFEPHNGVSGIPEWLDVRESTEEIQSHVPGQLSGPDWSCVALAEVEEGTVITNDDAMRNVCHDRDVEVRWGTKFMLQVFMSCGISQDEYEEGLPAYLDDLYLPPEVEEELEQKSK